MSWPSEGCVSQVIISVFRRRVDSKLSKGVRVSYCLKDSKTVRVAPPGVGATALGMNATGTTENCVEDSFIQLGLCTLYKVLF